MSVEGLATDTLNLPNVKTLRHVVSVGQHTYESASINPTGQCCMFARPNGTKRQVFADTPREGMPAVIHHKRRRWSCTVCGGSPYEDLPWAAEGRKMTDRLGEWILDQATPVSRSGLSWRAAFNPERGFPRHFGLVISNPIIRRTDMSLIVFYCNYK